MFRLITLLVAVLSIYLLPSWSHASTLASDLSRSLGESRRIVSQSLSKSRNGQPSSVETSNLSALRDELAALRLLHTEHSSSIASRALSLGGKVADRQQAVSSSLSPALDDLIVKLDAAIESGGANDLQQLLDTINRLSPSRPRPLLGALPYKHSGYSPSEPATTPLVVPAYKGGDRTVHPGDTSASAEAPLTREIVELAQSLQWNPVLIYEWVKNNVETEWYWGSMKGAEETLHQKSGNDADQASLLVALLRAANFPARYVRGTIDFFPGIEHAKNLNGLDDPLKIADFLRKSGIPVKAVISGGGIANFQIEHIWVEAFIPYSNYRGAVLDEQGKLWLGLDTSIKPLGYTRIQGGGVPADLLSTLRDDYMKGIQALTPLEYLAAKLDEQLAESQPGKSWSDLRDTAVLIPDVLKIIPDSMQFNQIAITGEYQALPDELKHKLTITATAGGNELFSITQDTHKLSNRRLALRAEPETVEDQNTIDSFGGLDNTPAYLVRLRPVLTLDGERLIVAQDGLPMGGDFTLNIDIITPNGTERISSSQVNGNLSVVGVVAQLSTKSTNDTKIVETDDAETILHKEAISYIDRWNRSEDDLAALLGQRITRPTVTIVTVGGQIEVAYLLDSPQDFQWKGLYLDAGYRRIETTGRNGLERDFMRLSSLQGSILENRVFEDDLKVDSLSTAKLLQLARAGATPVNVIDKTNIDAILPTLTFDDAVKADIVNAVNQGLTVSIPQNEIAYQDWSGIGYIKENPVTGEAGWMLSGQVAGGMTANIPLQWVQQNFLAILHAPYTGKVNRDPLAAKRLFVIGATDYQYGTVNTKLRQPLAVLVVDANNSLVRGARVTFSTVAGGGGFDTALSTSSITVLSNATGIARVPFYLGKNTGENPVYSKLDPIDPEVTQIGLNLVTASVEIANGNKVELADSFSSFAKPDVPVQITKMFGDNTSNVANNPAGSLLAKVVDQYDNPVSNVEVQFEAVSMELAKNIPQYGDPEPLPSDARPIKFYRPETCTVAYPIYGECSTFGVAQQRSGYAGCFVNTILGDTVNTKYTVDVTTPKFPTIDKVSFTVFSEGYRSIGAYLPHALLLRYLEQYTPEGFPVNATKVGTKLSTPLTAELLVYEDDYSMQSAGTCTKTILGVDISYPCWRIVPSGKTIVRKLPKDTGTVVFNVATGGGVVSATRDMGNGKYNADFTAGPVAERNLITVSGSGNIKVPEVLYDPQANKVVMTGYSSGNLTMRDINLPINNDILFNKIFNATGGHDPITRQTETLLYYTVFGVDTQLNVQPASIAITKEGKAKRNTAFTYTILPAEYNSIISDIDFFTRDPNSGIEEWAFQLHGDKTQGQGASTILAGSQWDVRKKYLARVTLNNGTAIEIDGTKTPVDIMLGALVPDYNHNRKIEPDDRDRAELGDKYYFWANDDDGNGDTEGTGIPGSGADIDPPHLKVNGTRDLVDFFPVHLDIKELFEVYDPATYKYRLRNADSALNYVVTDLGSVESAEYLTGENRGTDYARTMGEAPTLPITDTGFNAITAQYLALRPEMIENIKHDKGVILVEGYKRTTNPLALEVYNGTTLVYSQRLNLSIDGVEQMFRHKNLMKEMYKIELAFPGIIPPGSVTPVAGHPVPNEGMPDRLKLVDFSNQDHFTGFDAENDGKDFVYVHGYNMNGEEVRGAQTEIFKKLYWSGSRAKFWGITWYGYDSQAPFSLPCVGQRSPDYHVNVRHAFNAGKLLKLFAEDKGLGNATFAAHSLGNMMISTAIQEGMQYYRYLMTNSAVAEEAFTPRASYEGVNWSQSTQSLMIHPRWRYPHEDENEIGYKPFLWASEWYKRFNAPDARAGLSWRDYFSNVRTNPGNKTFVFYAPTDEAFLPFSYVIPPVGTPAEYPPNIDNVPGLEDLKFEIACFNPEKFGPYPWAMQELTKGRLEKGGMKFGGWGFNLDDGYYNSCTAPVPIGSDPPPFCGFVPPGDANALAEDVLMTLPLFKKNPDNAFLYSDQLVTRSMLSIAKQEELLANEIPALTFAAGHRGVSVFDTGGLKRNVNVQKRYLLDQPNAPWVRDPQFYIWKHNDLYYVGYPYVRQMFDDWVTIINSGEIK